MKYFKTKEFGRSNYKVIFLLSGWMNKLWMFWLFSKILANKGYYCITYEYNKDIISSNVEKTVKRLNEVRDDILEKIKTLKKEGHEDFSVFGTSLGSLIALMVANQSTEISKIILNTTGIDISGAVWSWDNVFPGFKQDLIRHNLTLPKLKRKWSTITPKNNVRNLKGKKILIYLSEKDEIIPYELGVKLVKEFEKRKYDYQLVINKKFKHVYTGLYNLVNAKVYLSFLNNDLS